MTETVIVADYRERPAEVPRLLGAVRGVRVVWKRLAVGDYIVDGRVTVERKTTADWMRSLLDGRLFSQASRLKSRAPRPLMVIEGPDPAAGLNPPRLDPAKVRGALVSLAAVWYLPVVRTGDQEETAEILVSMARMQRGRATGPYDRQLAKPKRGAARQLHVLQAIPLIGAQVARNLLGRFGSIRGVLAANREDLMEVPGVDPGRARAICQLVDAPWRDPDQPPRAPGKSETPW
ncbi:MAG: helix-hairpin-helix domain-containing protein [Planctomycetales bacterium]|nr:helix-hairpin-helix domain-containing protein [Planctomycetales bacterium]